MSESLIRAQIKAILETVSGIGAVYDYERYARSLGDYFAMMTKSGSTTVNGWIIHRERTVSQKATLGINGQIERTHTYRIAGLHDLDDATGSEKTFQGILDGIFEQFKANPTLNGTANFHDQVQIEEVTVCLEDEYGGDLYHVAECTLTVHERVNAST